MIPTTEAGEQEPINVAETLAEIRRRVAARLARTVPGIPELAVPPLEPLREARAVAESWAGGMGQVNPRHPGLMNSLVQFLKRWMARSLRWFAFPQTQFNSGVVASLIRTEEMFADINRNLVVLGQNLVDRERREAQLDETQKTAAFVLGVLRDDLERQEKHLASFASRIEEVSLSVGRAVVEVSESVTRSLAEIRDDLSRGIGETQGAVTRVEQELWKGFAEYRERQAALDDEVRVVRQRFRALAAPAATVVTAAAPTLSTFDYPKFEEKFRGKEDEIRRRQEFYLPMLKDLAPVLDIACGRGEMLELLRQKGIAAQGVDLDTDMVARCREKQLPVEQADALGYLEGQADGAFGAIFSAQFVEHLPVAVYSRLIELAKAKLRRGGRLILETQNPECLAIYSQTFFLDPTHVRPVPAAQLYFLLSEAGFTGIETHYLSPVSDSLPQLPLLQNDEDWNRAADRFNRTYFGHMDYAIVGVKP
jgi:SAM-dependent methyltransferase